MSLARIDITWEITLDGEEPRPIARWRGGAYIDLLDPWGRAVDVVGAFDYEKGEPYPLEELDASVRERIESEHQELEEEEEG